MPHVPPWIGAAALAARPAGGAGVTVWPFAWNMTADGSDFGSSTAAATYTPGPLDWITRDAPGATYYVPPNMPIPAAPPPVGAMNWGRGGTNAAEVTADILAYPVFTTPARVRAPVTILQYAGRWTPAVNNVVSGAFASFQTGVANLGHTNFVAINKHFDGAAPSGGLDWHRIRDFNRWVEGTYPGKMSDPTVYFRRAYTPRDATDAATMLTDRVANSLWGSNAAPGTDTAHLNGDDATLGYTSGNHLLGRDVWAPVYESRLAGGFPHVPHQRRYSADASQNQVLGGLVCELNYDPNGASLAGCTAAVINDPDFTAAVEVGDTKLRIRRATGTTITDGYRALQVRLTRLGKARDSWVIVYLGNTAPAGLWRTSLASQWIVREGSLNGVTTGQQLTIALGMKSNNTPATARGLLTTGASSATKGIVLATKASANQNVGLVCRDAANAIIVNMDSTAAQGFTAARGLQWYFACVDLTLAGTQGGGGTGKTAIDANAAVTAGGTATLGGTMEIFPAGLSDVLNVLFATTSAGAGTWDGELSAVWMGAGFLDIAPTANRDLFRDPVTKRSIIGASGGVIGGIDPFLWIEGEAGNLAAGANLGDLDLVTLRTFLDATDRAQMTSVAA